MEDKLKINPNINGCVVRALGDPWIDEGAEGTVLAGGINDRLLVKWHKTSIKPLMGVKQTHDREYLEVIDLADPNYAFRTRRF